MIKKTFSIEDFILDCNSKKKLFTAGPASLLSENITGLRPCFGRNDDEYTNSYKTVIDHIKNLSGQENVVSLQGSATLAIEIACLNFLFGKVLVISSGYYSERLLSLVETAKSQIGSIISIDELDWAELHMISGSYDWIVACSTETSKGLNIPISLLKDAAEKYDAKLMLDATASIGLEQDHDLADLMAFSSCKGLFGLTGGAFIAYSCKPEQDVNSFYLSLDTHIEKKVTGAYHSILSLADVLPEHDYFKKSVEINKSVFIDKFGDNLIYPPQNQPLLCTYLNCKLNNDDPAAILYKPRGDFSGSLVCHIGEVHLGANAEGAILSSFEVLNY